jgi:hypothetical protein
MRAAGLAVGAVFGWYFGLQAACAVLALVTALSWAWPAAGRAGVHKARAVVLAVALVAVGVGWWLDEEVEHRRVVRSEATDIVLKDSAPVAEHIRIAEEARANFGLWHFYSLMANFVTVGLVTAAMVLAAWLPARAEAEKGMANDEAPMTKEGRMTKVE